MITIDNFVISSLNTYEHTTEDMMYIITQNGVAVNCSMQLTSINVSATLAFKNVDVLNAWMAQNNDNFVAEEVLMDSIESTVLVEDYTDNLYTISVLGPFIRS